MSIDVVIPVFNCERYIAKAILSAIEQSCPASRIFVVDDGSTDASSMIVRKLCEKYEKLEYIRKPNGGLSSARNAGIRKTDADYVAFLDSDDEWHSAKLVSG